MLRLDFVTFQKRLELASSQFPVLHYLEKPKDITLIFRTKDGWKYYTILTDKDISEFAHLENYTIEEAIKKFKSEYCHNAIPLTDKELVYLDSVLESDENIEKSIITNEDIVIEANDYSEFLLKLFDSFETKVLNSVDNIKTDKKYMAKSIGDFLKNLFNTINTVAFIKQVNKYIKQDMLSGLISAESELNMDIGFTNSFEDKLKQLQAQQIDGYTINGKKWFGIKGVTKELQSKIISTVQKNIKENSSLDKIKEEIKKDFNGFSDWRSNMIARTETNRIINESKVLGYKESGIKGKKVWSTALDNRTSDVCRRLNNKAVNLDEDFIDPETRKAFQTPPAHPNCRSVIFFSIDKN